MFAEHLLGHLVGLLDHLLGFGVDLLGRQFRIGLREGHVALARGVVEGERADVLAHAVVGHHSISLLGDALQIVERPGRNLAEGQLLGNAASERSGQLVHHLLARGDLTFLGQIPGGAQRLAARDDRHLDQRAGVFENPAHRGVSRLVEGDHALLLVGDDLVLALQAAHDAVDGGEEVLFRNEFLVVARGDQRGLVADVGDVGARETGGLARQERTVQLRIELQRTQVDVENLLALLHVGKSHLDLAVETPGAHQCLVEDVGPVGGGQNDDARIGLEAVHLRQKLVQRIFALVVARESGVLAAGAADGVDLVDEDDAGSLLLGLLEQVADTRGAHADEHLDEIGTRNREERHVGLPCDGLGQQGLARSRRAYEQRALRNLGAQLLVFVGLLEEIDDLHDLDLRLLQAGHILERHALGVVLVEDLRLGFADVHNATAASGARAARHGAHDKEPRSDDHHPRQQVDQNRGPVVGLVFIDHRNGLPRLLLGGLQILAKRIYRTDGESQLHARLGQAAETLVHRVVAVLLAGLLFQEHLRLVAVHDLDLLHVALLNHLLHGGPVAGQRRFIAAVEQIPADDEQTDQAVDPQHRRPRHVHIHFIVVLAFLCHNPDYSSYSYFTSGASAHSSSSL